jgi:hypothetical protein
MEPFPIPSTNRHRYFLIFWMFILGFFSIILSLANLMMLSLLFFNFKPWLKDNFSPPLKQFKLIGVVNTTNSLRFFLKKIWYNSSIVLSIYHEQNGKIEHRNHHIIEPGFGIISSSFSSSSLDIFFL